MTGVRHLLVDARPLEYPGSKNRGIGRYVAGLLQGLVRIGAPVTALYGSDDDRAAIARDVADVESAMLDPELVRRYDGDGVWYLATLMMQNPVPYDSVPSMFTRARLPVASIMYDVIPLRHPERYLVDRWPRAQMELCVPMARTVDAMLAISTFAADTASDLLRYPRDRIAVIGAGIDERFRVAAETAFDRPGRVLPADVDRYVIAVTGADERKNTEGLLRAWSLLPPAIAETHHLVIACAAPRRTLEQWRRWAVEFGVADRVVLTDAVSDDEMVALHQHARLSVMPSLDEGFGLPVIEAAVCRCPAITSDVSSLPEVLDEPLATFSPYDAASIAAKIAEALTDDELRDRLTAAGRRAADRWRWDRVAADAVAALERLGPRWRVARRPLDRRIAFAGPMEGSASGIATYDIAVVEALEHRVNGGGAGTSGTDVSGTDVSGTGGVGAALTVLVESAASTEPTAGHARRFPLRSLGHSLKPWDFDEIVIVLGSSHFHTGAAEIARDVAGHLWLHEPSLVGVHVGLAHASKSVRWATDYLSARFAAADADERRLAAEVDPLDAPGLDERGVTLLGEVLDRARSVIVNTSQAADTVRRLRPDGPPVLVLPLAHRRVGPERAVPSNHDIVAFGWIAPNKDPELALDVLARVVQQVDDARLVFAGAPSGDTAAQVEAYARALGLADRVVITGRLSDTDYARWITTARVALQLRRGERGEMSGPIVDCSSAGTPVITNLRSAGPTTEGVQVIDHTDRIVLAQGLADAAVALLSDDVAWTTASRRARRRAADWQFDDVADALVRWLEEWRDHAPGTVVRGGPIPGAGER